MTNPDQVQQHINDAFLKHENLVAQTLIGNEFVLERLVEIAGGFTGKTVLDIGCGKGRYCREFALLGAEKVIGIDPIEEFVKAARENCSKFVNVDCYCSTGSNIPLQNESVDFVFMGEVVEHIADIDALVIEVYRVLKSGGKVVIFDKHANALHPRYLIPISFWKSWMERRGDWMYESNSLFKEKWYSISELSAELSKVFSEVNVFHEYSRGRSKVFFKLLPKKTWMYAFWVAKK